MLPKKQKLCFNLFLVATWVVVGAAIATVPNAILVAAVARVCHSLTWDHCTISPAP